MPISGFIIGGPLDESDPLQDTAKLMADAFDVRNHKDQHAILLLGSRVSTRSDMHDGALLILGELGPIETLSEMLQYAVELARGLNMGPRDVADILTKWEEL